MREEAHPFRSIQTMAMATEMHVGCQREASAQCMAEFEELKEE